MKSLFVALALFGAVAFAFTPNWYNSWVILIAGGNGWDSYPDQSSMYKLYQIFRRNGVYDNRIITFFADDVAFNDENPFPGEVYNEEYKEGGANINVYRGVPKDYTGDAASADTFIKVMNGINPSVGSGKVLRSTWTDDVLIYYVGTGGSEYSQQNGYITMPNKNDNLHRDSFVQLLTNLTKGNKYKRLMTIVDGGYADSFLHDIYFKNTYMIGSAKYGGRDYCVRDAFIHQYVQSCWTHVFTDLLETKGFSTTIEDIFGSFCDSKVSYTLQYGDSLVKNMTLSAFINSYGANTLRFPQTPADVPGVPLCNENSCSEGKCDCYTICKKRGYPDDRCTRLCCYC